MRVSIQLLPPIIIFSFLWGCQARHGQKMTAPIPDWILRVPHIEGMICAIGTSGPTYFPGDAKKQAAENARKELAGAISIDIKSIMIDITTGGGSEMNEATIIQVSSWATSTVVKEARIIEYWYDSEGMTSEGKKVFYALCCMPREFLLKGFEHK